MYQIKAAFHTLWDATELIDEKANGIWLMTPLCFGVSFVFCSTAAVTGCVTYDCISPLSRSHALAAAPFLRASTRSLHIKRALSAVSSHLNTKPDLPVQKTHWARINTHTTELDASPATFPSHPTNSSRKKYCFIINETHLISGVGCVCSARLIEDFLLKSVGCTFCSSLMVLTRRTIIPWRIKWFSN